MMWIYWQSIVVEEKLFLSSVSLPVIQCLMMNTTIETTTTKVFPNMEEKHLWFFSKSGYTKSVIEQARKDHAMLLTIDDLFD